MSLPITNRPPPCRGITPSRSDPARPEPDKPPGPQEAGSQAAGSKNITDFSTLLDGESGPGASKVSKGDTGASETTQEHPECPSPAQAGLILPPPQILPQTEATRGRSGEAAGIIDPLACANNPTPQPKLLLEMSLDPSSAGDRITVMPAPGTASEQPAPLSPAPRGASLEQHASPPAILSPRDVPMQIASAAQDGITRFSIRLDPVELGRIDVELAIDSNGAIRTHIIVERPETLHALQADAVHFQESFADAGLESEAPRFSLNSGGGSHQQANEQAFSPAPDHPDDNRHLNPMPLIVPDTLYARLSPRLDLIV